MNKRKHLGPASDDHTVPMYDAGGLWQCLHPQNSPKVHPRIRVLSIRGIPAQNQQIVAQDPNQWPWCQLRSKAVHLDGRSIPLGIDSLKRHNSLAHNSGQQKLAIHNQTPAVQKRFELHVSKSTVTGWGLPMRLNKWTREFAPYPSLPLDKLAP